MVSESTTDFAYCRVIIGHQLRYAESCKVQAEYDYPHGAPIALFTMLWIEGYINHLIATLFPHKFESEAARNTFQKEYRGTKEKFKYLISNLGLDLTWPQEFAELLKFRNRVCHAVVVETDFPNKKDFSFDEPFIDSFQVSIGTMTQLKARHTFTEIFLKNLHDLIKEMPVERVNALYLRKLKGETEFEHFNFEVIKHPIYSSLADKSC